MTPAFRNGILQVHRWTGLTVGLVAAFLAVTGLTMVFRAQLQPLAEAKLREVPPCRVRIPLDGLIALASTAHPGAKVLQVELPDGFRGTTIVRFANQDGVYLDSCTGAILGEKNRWAGFFGVVEWLHRLRWAGDADVTEPIGGSVSLIVALVIVAGGLTLWWPRSRKALKNALKFRLRGLEGRAFDLTLHRTLGAYVALVLLMSTLTSLTFTFEWARHLVFAAAGSAVPPAKPKLAPAEPAPMARAEAFLARAREASPGAREVQILFPRKPADAVEVQALDRDAPHANARTFLYLDPGTAATVCFEPYSQLSPGVRAYRWLGALHQGEVGGWPIQMLLFAGILGVPVLAFTGVRGFLRRNARPPRRL